MAELPEITILADQMNDRLVGYEITAMLLGQVKSLNAEPSSYMNGLLGRKLLKVEGLGKWLVLRFDGVGPVLMIHPGMGMDLVDITVETEKEPQFVFDFGEQAGFSIKFWWFGKIHLAEPGTEKQVGGNLGPVPLNKEFTPEVLSERLMARQNRGLKSFLMDQKTIAGIGNVWVQDILFKIGAHPKTKIRNLNKKQKEGLFEAIEATLQNGIKLGFSRFEMDYWGKKGDWGNEKFQIGYRTGKPCPVCKTNIEKIKTGSTHTYICPRCQPEIN